MTPCYLPVIISEPPEAPGRVDVQEVGSRWVSVSWGAPYSAHAPISHYVIQFREEETTLGGGMSSWNNVTVGGNIHKARLGTLRPATSYKLRLLAVNEVGAGPPSESTLALTLQEGEDNRSDEIFKDSLNTSLSNRVIFFIYTAPSGPPIDISVEAMSPESLLVKWKVRVIPNRVQ